MKTEIELLEGRLKILAEKTERTRARITAIKVREARLAEEKNYKHWTRNLAKEHGILVEDEFKEFDRVSVWAPESVSEENDPFSNNHYVYSWVEAYKRVKAYAQLVSR